MLKIVVSLFIFLNILSAKCPVKTYIPEKAKELAPLLYSEVNLILPRFEEPYYFQALIEHESCVALCGKGYWARRCWSYKSELKTKKEQGVGFFQITRTFRRDGRVKSDNLRSLKRKYPKELKGLNWDNIKDKPNLQLKAGLLLWKDIWLRLPKKLPLKVRIAFADSIFNGGYLLYRERRICKLRKGCDPDKWFNNVEDIKDLRNSKKLYGNRTAYDINRHHVRDVLKVRLKKYIKLYRKTVRIRDGL